MLGKTSFNIANQQSSGAIVANVSGTGQLSGSQLLINIQEDGYNFTATGTKQ
jgi:hypothetical protein